MALRCLDHVSIVTANLDEMSRFYAEVIGLEKGYRPPLVHINGTWHYCAGKPVIHLVEADRPRELRDPQIEHFAFRGEDMDAFLANLKARGVPFKTAIVPDLELRQAFFADPDGNRVEVQFDRTEEADLTNFDG